MLFDDEQRWDGWSFLGLLNRNEIPFSYKNHELLFPTKNANRRAEVLWKCLTGNSTIGKFTQ